MSYDEDEVLGDSEPSSGNDELELDDPLDDDLFDEPTEGFRFDEEEETETV